MSNRELMMKKINAAISKQVRLVTKNVKSAEIKKCQLRLAKAKKPKPKPSGKTVLKLKPSVNIPAMIKRGSEHKHQLGWDYLTDIRRKQWYNGTPMNTK